MRLEQAWIYEERGSVRILGCSLTGKPRPTFAFSQRYSPTVLSPRSRLAGGLPVAGRFSALPSLLACLPWLSLLSLRFCVSASSRSKKPFLTMILEMLLMCGWCCSVFWCSLLLVRLWGCLWRCCAADDGVRLMILGWKVHSFISASSRLSRYSLILVSCLSLRETDYWSSSLSLQAMRLDRLLIYGLNLHPYSSLRCLSCSCCSWWRRAYSCSLLFFSQICRQLRMLLSFRDLLPWVVRLYASRSTTRELCLDCWQSLSNTFERPPVDTRLLLCPIPDSLQASRTRDASLLWDFSPERRTLWELRFSLSSK